MSGEKSRHGTGRTVGLAALIGAGTSFAWWPLMFVWMIVGLTVGMPTDMGGMGLPLPVVLLLAGGAVVLAAVGILLVVMHLLRYVGTAHPVAVALIGTLLTTCLFGGSGLLAAQTAPGWVVALMLPISGAGGFAIMARLASHRTVSTAVACVCVVAIVVFLTW